MKKILVVGQAPPAVEQKYPYDTTFFYDWMTDLGISILKAQEIFDFDAVFGTFTGYDTHGHKKPTQEQMDGYWYSTLKAKVDAADKILVLGNVAKDYLNVMAYYKKPEQFLYLIHPSKRNYNRIVKEWTTIVSKLKNFLEL